MAIFYVNGHYVEDSIATLPITDLAILRGYAVFDFLRTYNGKPFHLDDHLRRLKKSAALLHLPCPWTLAEMTAIVNELLQRNNFWETNLRFIITGGDSSDSISPENLPRLVIMATELQKFPKEWYNEGVKVITSHATRYIPGSKSTNYIKAIMALRSARSRGAVESVYVNERGEMLEGTTSNIFGVIDSSLVTPVDDILPGITRQVVITLASGKIPLQMKQIVKSELAQYSEIFLTSSNKEVLPVVSVDDVVISDGPGPVTRSIMKLFRQYTSSW